MQNLNPMDSIQLIEISMLKNYIDFLTDAGHTDMIKTIFLDACRDPEGRRHRTLKIIMEQLNLFPQYRHLYDTIKTFG